VQVIFDGTPRNRAGETNREFAHVQGAISLSLIARPETYGAYCYRVRTHLSLDKNAPDVRRPQRLGRIAAMPILGGLRVKKERI